MTQDRSEEVQAMNAGEDALQRRRGYVSDLNREESKRLRAIWDSTKDKPPQAVFGEMYGIGGQAAVGHFLNGVTAISLKAARGFAEGLRCEISAFSERLANEAAALGMVSGYSEQLDLTSLDRRELRLVLMFRQLPVEKKAEVLQQVEQLYVGDQSGVDDPQRTRRPTTSIDSDPSVQEAAPEPPSLLVSLDGGKTFAPASGGVRLIYTAVMAPGKDELGELHVNATHEGLITDLWGLGQNLGTRSELVDDLVERLVAEPLDECESHPRQVIRG